MTRLISVAVLVLAACGQTATVPPIDAAIKATGDSTMFRVENMTGSQLEIRAYPKTLPTPAGYPYFILATSAQPGMSCLALPGSSSVTASLVDGATIVKTDTLWTVSDSMTIVAMRSSDHAQVGETGEFIPTTAHGWDLIITGTTDSVAPGSPCAR